MQAEIDISLLTETSAIGRVYGPMEFACLPRIGETVSFPSVVDSAAEFNGHLIVEHVIHSAASGSSPMLSLSDIVASSEAGGKEIGVALAQKYGLLFEPYGD